MKLAKVSNDRDFRIEVSYKDDKGKEVKEVIEPGDELEVPSDAGEAVKSQVSDATDPEPALQKMNRATRRRLIRSQAE